MARGGRTVTGIVGADSAPGGVMMEKITQQGPAATQHEPLLVDEQEARRLLGNVCLKTMYNLRKSGALPVVMVRDRVMYDVADLRAFIQKQKAVRA
jgi:hypothetical protein